MFVGLDMMHRIRNTMLDGTPNRTWIMAFASIMYELSSKILAIDGCPKVATDHVSLERIRVPRKAPEVDADLRHELLALSILIFMAFGRRWSIRSVEMALKHTWMERTKAVGARWRFPDWPRWGIDDDELFGTGGLDGLARKTRQDLTTMYGACLETPRGITM